MIVVFSGHQPALHDSIPVFGSEDDTLVLDATKLTWASPMDLTGLAAWASAGSPLRTSLLLPENPSLSNYLHRMDVPRSMSEQGVAVHGPRAPEVREEHSDQLIEVRRMDGQSDVSLFASDVYRLVNTNVGDKAARVVHSLLGELLDNVTRHARSESGSFGAAQVYTGATTGRAGIEISVSDPGRGILAALRSNPAFAGIPDCRGAIDASLQEGVTGDAEMTDVPGHGNGLPRVVTQLRTHHGRMVLRSGDAVVRITARRRLRTVSVSVPGTWAWIRLDTQDGRLAS